MLLEEAANILEPLGQGASYTALTTADTVARYCFPGHIELRVYVHENKAAVKKMIIKWAVIPIA